ncbi:hypothetical protein [Erythrobacter sp.]|uniref:hypothetical protein n=1 Tax=Erythrobacter sp. TaxID=1042 RepID=UPI0032672A57
MLFLAAALHNYASGLQNLDLKQFAYSAMIPWDGWNTDWTIVTLSALLSIAFIPVAWIYLFASRVAFWLVTVFSVLELFNVPFMFWAVLTMEGSVSGRYLLTPALLAAALVCLWLPLSRTWLRQRGGVDAGHFD